MTQGNVTGAEGWGGLCCRKSRGWQGQEGSRGWELSPDLERGVGKLCTSKAKEQRASKHPQPWEAFLCAPRSQSHVQGSTLTPALLELRSCWVLGCLGHTVV